MYVIVFDLKQLSLVILSPEYSGKNPIWLGS